MRIWKYEIQNRNLIFIAIGLLAIIFSFIFLRGSKLFYFIFVLSLIVIVLPFVISVIIESGSQKEKEEKFLEFARDLVENVKSGTPVNRAVMNLAKRDYGELTAHVQKLANQLSLGIPLTEGLANFAIDIKSHTISRAVSLISEAERSGGEIDTILESVANSVNQTEELKKERKSSIFNLVVQGYIIFIVFIIIMLVLEFKILPLTADIGSVGDLNTGGGGSMGDLSAPLMWLILTQSLFTGLVIGKLAEGNFKAGVKHSFILIAITLIVVTGARVFLG